MARPKHYLPRLEVLEDRIVPDNASAGPAGIGARNLDGTPLLYLFNGLTPLTGAQIPIGQVEVGRPGKPQPPNDPNRDNAGNSHPDVVPTAVWRQNQAPTANSGPPNGEINDHAEKVAGVLIANGATDKGVSPQAMLYSSAAMIGATLSQTRQLGASSLQKVVRPQTGILSRAINNSWASILAQGEERNGNTLETQFIDWSARFHDALYVISASGDLPNDAFNAMVVGATKRSPVTFREIDLIVANGASGPRRSLNLVARV